MSQLTLLKMKKKKEIVNRKESLEMDMQLSSSNDNEKGE